MSKPWYIYVHEVCGEHSPDSSRWLRDWSLVSREELAHTCLMHPALGAGRSPGIRSQVITRGVDGAMTDMMVWTNAHCAHEVVVDPLLRL